MHGPLDYLEGRDRCRPDDACPCPANGFAVFRRPPPVAPDRSLSADRHVPDTGGQPCANSFGLWQQSWLSVWPFGLLGTERSCAADLSPAAIRPHLRRTGLPRLHVPENRVDRQSHPRTCAGAGVPRPF